MISFRYHIVSIMGVFLALGLGILLGSSVVSDPLSAQLHADLERANDQRDEARSRASEASASYDSLRERVSDEVAAWVLGSRLADRRFVIVRDGAQDELGDHVVASLVRSGAQQAGTLVLEQRLTNLDDDSRAELVRTMTSIVPPCEGDIAPDCFDDSADLEPAEVVEAAMTHVGRRFDEPTGRVIVDALIDAGFMSAPSRPSGEWPPSDAIVVVVSASRAPITGPSPSPGPDTSPTPGADAFAREVAEGSTTVVATDDAEGRSVVSQLRASRGLPPSLATFDSATDAEDPGGIGLVAATIAALEGRGGHFGSAGESFVAPAPKP